MTGKGNLRQSKKIGTLAVIRTFDLVLASLFMILLSPLLMVLCLMVWRDLGRPVFFRQLRAGKDNSLFQIIKFRTMRDAHGVDASLSYDEVRLTGLGRFLRKASLDELPELINVLRGEMSLVGPRPLLPEYYLYYTDRERLRLTIRPGITGLAQVSGRNFVGWDRKLELDAKYAEHLSVWLYLKILFRTPFAVLNWQSVAANPWTAEQPLSIERAGKVTSAQHPGEAL